MRIYYKGQGINTESLFDTLNYLMTLVNKKSSGGFFTKIALNDSGLIEEFQESHQGINHQINTVLQPLGIVTVDLKGGKAITPKGKIKYKKSRYAINKDNFLIWYFFCEAANRLNQKQVSVNKSRYHLDFELEPIIKSMIDSMMMLPVGELFFFTSKKYGKAKELEELYINSLIVHYYNSMYSNICRTIGDRYNYIYLNSTSRFFIPSIEKEYIQTLDYLSNYSYTDTICNSTNMYLSYLSNYIQFIYNVLYITAKKDCTSVSVIDKKWFTNDLITKKEEPFSIQELYKKEKKYKYSSNKEITNQFYSLDLMTLKPIKVYTDELSQNELKNLKMDFAIFVCRNSIYFKKLNEYISKLIKGGRNTSLRLNVEANFHKKNSYYEVKVSCRQNNQLCLLKKETRKQVIKNMGFGEKDNFDLHGAIFSVARLINKNEWSCDWDIKKDLSEKRYVDEDGVIIELSKEDLRPVLYRSFFTKDFEDTYKKYEKKQNTKEIKRFKDDNAKETKTLSKEVFRQVYDDCQEWTGGTLELTSNIFMIESIIELSLLLQHDIIEGLENVYDGFYFSPYLHIETIKDELDVIAMSVKTQFDEWKNMGAFTYDFWKKESCSLWSY